MKRLIILILTVLTLVGCSSFPLSSFNPLKDDKGLEVNAQVGKNNTQVQTDNKSLVSASSNDKTEISNTTSSNNTANVVNQSTSTSSDKSGISTKNSSKTTNDNKADTINQATSTITNYPIPKWLIIAFALAMPTPLSLIRTRREKKERKERESEYKTDIKYLREQLRERTKIAIDKASEPVKRPVAENA